MPEVEFAKDTKTFVELFLQMGVSHQWFYRMMIGRLYYAAHHLGRRLLVEVGLQPDQWRGSVHQQVMSELYQHYVSTGLMTMEACRALGELCDLRGEADYELQKRRRLRDVNRAVALFTRFSEECCRILEVS
ncbi:MAG: hypothetical protein HY318_12170 [Armatimonadetes bacterium]|nr:hypothetical protein [Armatimonadota bacterium]